MLLSKKLKVHSRTILVHITSMAQQLYAEKILKSGKVLKHSDWVKQSMIIKCWLSFNEIIYYSLKVMQYDHMLSRVTFTDGRSFYGHISDLF